MAKYLYGASIQGIQEYICATRSRKEQTKQKSWKKTETIKIR